MNDFSHATVKATQMQLLFHYVSNNDTFNVSRIVNKSALDSKLMNEQDDGTGLCLLHHAVNNRAPEMVRLLLNSGANVNAIAHTKANKITPLQAAVLKRDYNIALSLIDSHADVNMQDSTGKTSLHIAASTNNKSIVQLLLAAYADPNISDRHGFTPRLYALKSGFSSVAELLPEKNFDMWAELKRSPDYQKKVDLLRADLDKKQKKKEALAAKKAKKKK